MPHATEKALAQGAGDKADKEYLTQLEKYFSQQAGRLSTPNAHIDGDTIIMINSTFTTVKEHVESISKSAQSMDYEKYLSDYIERLMSGYGIISELDRQLSINYFR